MNKKGFTLVELVAVIVIILIMMFLGISNLIPSVERNTKKSFLTEAIVISEGARNRFQDDRLNNVTVQDSLFNSDSKKTCYIFESALKNKYVTKYSTKYVGSVEVCHELDCEYQTKIWLTDGEHYLNGVVTDKTLSKSDIDKKFNNDYYLTCGVNPLDLDPEYNFEFIKSEEEIVIVRDGIYSLEAWGAQGGRYTTYRGGYGGYSYTEVELHKGDKLYINVGGEGTLKAAGYNNAAGPSGTSSPAGGGGATSITTKSGFLSSKVLLDYVLIVAGGGGGATRSTCCCTDALEVGGSGGGACSESTSSGRMCQSGGAYGKASKAGAGGGYRASTGADCNNRAMGGSGFIGNPLTFNGWMSGYNVENNDGIYTKTISTTNVSDDPVRGYAKQGNGYAKIKLIDDYSIIYELNGGTLATPNKTSYSKTTNTFTLNNPTKPAYAFTGWIGSNGLTPSTNVSIPKGSTGNKNFKAVFTPIEYTITYNLDGGTLAEGVTNPTTYNVETTSFTLKNPTKDGYKFIGWVGTGVDTPQETITIANGSTGNKTFTARYEKLYNVTLDYNIESYTLPGGTSYMDSGFTPDWNNNFVIDMDINIPTSGKRYLIIGNYDTSNQINLEVNDANKLRAYQGGDKATSGAITIGEDANYIFTYTASDKSFTYTYTSTSTDISKEATLTSSGYSGATLRLGHDYRSKSTFTAYTLNGLKITSLLAMSYLPSNVTRPGYTFDGWYTSKTGGTKISSATIPTGESITYYAHWNQ